MALTEVTYIEYFILFRILASKHMIFTLLEDPAYQEKMNEVEPGSHLVWLECLSVSLVCLHVQVSNQKLEA
jgi:hypothetical protein